MIPARRPRSRLLLRPDPADVEARLLRERGEAVIGDRPVRCLPFRWWP